jgi:hypothetical protein
MRSTLSLFTACEVHCMLMIFMLAGTVCTLSLQGNSQEVRVDVTPSHVTNTFSPLYALGTTVDRVPSNATDMFFRPDQLKQVLSAGWGAVSYRQNTELFVQAWHWNLTDIRSSIAASPETAELNSTASRVSTTKISTPTGRVIPT